MFTVDVFNVDVPGAELFESLILLKVLGGNRTPSCELCPRNLVQSSWLQLPPVLPKAELWTLVIITQSKAFKVHYIIVWNVPELSEETSQLKIWLKNEKFSEKN